MLSVPRRACKGIADCTEVRQRKRTKVRHRIPRSIPCAQTSARDSTRALEQRGGERESSERERALRAKKGRERALRERESSESKEGEGERALRERESSESKEGERERALREREEL
jgi:hypothetical protein